MSTPALRVAVLVKQVPRMEDLELDADGRLDRGAAEGEMNPYCRRALAKGVELATASGGSCVALTMGPPAAAEVLREAVAYGADRGWHVCDPRLAGSDTLVTARVLAAALTRYGPFDLVLLGRSSIDGDTGQVGPQLAQLLRLPFASAVRRLELRGRVLTVECEHDEAAVRLALPLPAVLSVAERLCPPAKSDPAADARVELLPLDGLALEPVGRGPWGAAGSRTRVGPVRRVTTSRERRVLTGPVSAQVRDAVDALTERGALAGPDAFATGRHDRAGGSIGARRALSGPCVAVLVDGFLREEARPLLGEAHRLARALKGHVTAVGADIGTEGLGAWGADHVVAWQGGATADAMAVTLSRWIRARSPWAVLGPATAYGREVLGRAAAALGLGLVGDAVALHLDGAPLADRPGLLADKPGPGGTTVAEIGWSSLPQLVTLRPGTLPLPTPRAAGAAQSRVPVPARGRVRLLSRTRVDTWQYVERASRVVGVGQAVPPEEYPVLAPLLDVLGAELVGTRKVTDHGWLPRSRQIGITGRSIAPRLYVAVGLSGKFTHMVGVAAAGTVLAINQDPGAPVFEFADVGITADWRDALPLLATEVQVRQCGRADGESRPAAGAAAGRRRS